MTLVRPKSLRFLEAMVAIAILLLGLACTWEAVRWVGRPFPGFLWAERLTVNQLGMRSSWEGHRLGLRANEQLVAIDGKAVETSTDLRAELARFSPGETHRFDFAGRAPLVLRIERFEWGDLVAVAGLPIGSGFMYLLLGAWVRRMRPGRRDSALLYYFCMVAAAYNLTIFDNATDHTFRLAWILALTQLPATMVPLAVIFRPGPLEARHRWLVAGFAGACAVLGVAYAAVGALPAALNLLWLVILGMLGLGFILGMVGLFWTRWRTPGLLVRRQVDLVILGLLLSTAPSVVWSSCNVFGFEPFPFQLAAAWYLSFPALIAYAIVRHRLFDVSLVLRRSLTYTLVTLLLGGAYLLASLAIGLVVQRPAMWLQLALTAAIAVSYAPLRDAVRSHLDRTFFRAPYDFQAIVARFATVTRRTPDLATIQEAFARELNEALHPTSLSIREGTSTGPGTRVLSDGGLTIPLLVGGDPLGHVSLGPRQADLPYGPEDRALVQALCQQLSFAIRTSELLARVQEQLVEQERYIRRLVESEDVIARLQEIDRIRGEAFSQASHDLRAPLASIGYVCQGLERGLFGPLGDDARQEVAVIRGNALALGALIDGVLDQAKHESRRLVLDLAPVSCEEVVRTVVPMLEPLARAADTALEVRWEELSRLPKLQADARRLQQVLLNLVSNAVKFTPDGTVTIAAEAMGKEAVLRVTDTGAGMTPEQVARAGTPFEGGAANSLAIAGTGLGLSLVRTIADWHGARFAIESEVGVGTTVTLFWPLASAEAGPHGTQDLVEVHRLGEEPARPQ